MVEWGSLALREPMTIVLNNITSPFQQPQSLERQFYYYTILSNKTVYGNDHTSRNITLTVANNPATKRFKEARSELRMSNVVVMGAIVIPSPFSFV